jgi:uncharacterized protein YdaU (DUF1376 family)
MSKAPSMPLFCGDYLAATVGLSLEQSGAFLHILMATWAGGGKPLPDDDAILARVCRITCERWQKKIRPALAPLFDLSSGTWRNERLEREWSYVQKVIAKRREAGAKGGRPSKNGPGNGPDFPAQNREEISQNADANPRKNNETSKANGSVLLKQNESTLPNSSTYHVEDTITPDPIEPAPAPIGAGERKVAYSGKCLTLNGKTFDQWKARYSAIPDFLATLATIDEDEAGKKSKNPYGAAQNRLLAIHNAALAKKQAAKPRPFSNRAGIRVLGGRGAA